MASNIESDGKTVTTDEGHRIGFAMAELNDLGRNHDGMGRRPAAEQCRSHGQGSEDRG